MTCLPDELWSDPTCIYLRKRRRRLWQLLCDMERLRSRYHPDDVARWSVAVWAANLDVTERRLTLDLIELRGLGLVDPDAIRLSFSRPVEPTSATNGERDSPTRSNSPRPRYPSDESRLRKDSAATPQTAPPDSAEDSASTPQADIESNRIESNDSDINIDSRIDSINAPPKLSLDILPADIVQAMVRACKGALTQHRARELFEKHGAARSRDVVESLAHWKPKNAVRLLERALADGHGKYPVHAKVIEAREKAARADAQPSLNIVSLVTVEAAPSEEINSPSVKEQAELNQFHLEQFFLGLSPEEQARIDQQVRQSLPAVHAKRWQEGEPPPLFVRDAVEAKRAEILRQMMEANERRCA